MEVVIAEPDELTQLAAGTIEKLLRSRPGAVLGLATGSIPLPIYDELVRLHVQDGLSFARAKAFTLDEYVGLPPDHPQRPVSAMRPATILQHHPHVTALVDNAAASRLQPADYYRGTFAAKPVWQGL